MNQAYLRARLALITIALLFTCGVSRAAEQYASAGAVFTAIPAALRTPPDGKWTLPRTFDVNQWLKQHVEGKSIGVVFQFSRVGKSMDQADAHGTCPQDMPKELTDLYFEGFFPNPADAAKLKKAKRDDVLNCTAVIKHAEISYRPRSGQLVFSIVVDHASLK